MADKSAAPAASPPQQPVPQPQPAQPPLQPSPPTQNPSQSPSPQQIPPSGPARPNLETQPPPASTAGANASNAPASKVLSRQHPPITAPLVQNAPPRAATSGGNAPPPPPYATQTVQSFRAAVFPPGAPTPTTQEGIPPSGATPQQDYGYTYQSYPYPPPYYRQPSYEPYSPPPPPNSKKRQLTASGANDPFGMSGPAAAAASSRNQQQPPFPTLYQNPYSVTPQGQYPMPSSPNSTPFPLGSGYMPPGQYAPGVAPGFPPLNPYLPTGLVPEASAPSAPKRKRAPATPSPLGLPPGEAQPKRRRKAPEDLISDGDPFNFSKWTPSDDVLLKDCIQGAPSFEKIAKTVRFSAKFTPEQIKNRWNALLYDTKLAGEAAAAMAQLPSINRRVLWSEQEENILRTEVHSTHFVSFQKVLEKNRAIFHSSRTAKSLEAHYYRMKRHGTLQKTNFANLTNTTFSQMEQSLYSSSDGAHFTDPDTLKDRQKQYRSLEKGTQRTTLRLEKELAREKDKRQKLLAVFRGKFLRYEMKSKEILLGRMSSDTVVDVDLSEEGNAAKVSRQQAIIKLKRDCEFYIKNIGRRLIFINGKPLERGKKARLVDAALIEIHNLHFIFEINRGVLNKIKKNMQS